MTAAMTAEELLTYARQRTLQGDLRGAANFVAMVLEKHPTHVDALALSAQLAFQLGDTSTAFKHAQTALQRRADNPLALTIRGGCYQQAGRLADAIRDFDAVTRHCPTDALAFSRLATCLRLAGNRPASLAAYQQAVQLAPTHVDTWNNLGVVAQELGQDTQAIAAYQQALALRGDMPLAHNNLAALLQQHGRLDEAESHYQRAVALAPDYAVAWKNLAALWQIRQQWADALAAYDRATAIEPHYAEAIAGGLFMAGQLAQWEGLASRQQSLNAALAVQGHARIPPFAQLAQTDDPIALRHIAERWAAAYPTQPLPAQPRAQGSKIRLGYLGGDFYAHATSWLTAGLFRRHDRTKFELFGYDYGPNDGSAIRAKVIGDFDHFQCMTGQPALNMAQRIQADGIDILIDLKGWTRDTHTEVLSLRPAPVQVHYVAYPGTLGAPWCDYLIGDAIVTPKGAEADFTEALVRLPHSYQINDSDRAMAPTPTRRDVGLPEHALVFCCFNQHYKLQPEVFAAWMGLLGQLPDSVLWLLEGHPAARSNLTKAALAAGIDPVRLVFAPHCPQAEHLARLALADIALDTQPFCSHTTASDALWAGVPLVTQTGRSYASRVAASCLHAVGLPELVTDSRDAYLALAHSLAVDAGRRQALRAHLLAARHQQALFDTAATVLALEKAYEAMWARHLAGQSPSALDLT